MGIKDATPYNPLDKKALANSIAQALLSVENPPISFPDPTLRGKARIAAAFEGAGVYCIYYLGEQRPFPPYARIAAINRDNLFQQPIYVGKAVPKGARKGGSGWEVDTGTVLFDRIMDHGRSILDASSTLDLADFRVRFLRVDDIWIPLAESLLINRFRPIWNLVIEGFGNHDPGGGRTGQQRSPWDTIHPGRRWALKLPENARDADAILINLDRFLSGSPAQVADDPIGDNQEDVHLIEVADPLGPAPASHVDPESPNPDV